MDDRKLQVFLKAVHTGSFSQASEELNCTQSAVTQSINALETELGNKLLQRSYNGVQLTPEGKRLLPIVAEAEAALARLKTAAAQRTTPIRLGSFSSIANTWLPKVIYAYRKYRPEATFDIRIGTDIIASWLQADEIDLALGDKARCGHFRWYPLMEDSYYAVAPYTLIPEDISSISQEKLVEYPFIMAPLNALTFYLSWQPKKSIQINSDDDSTLLHMVAQGIGVTAMPGLSLHSLPDGVRVMELVPETKRILGAAVPASPRKELQEFIAFLTENFDILQGCYKV